MTHSPQRGHTVPAELPRKVGGTLCLHPEKWVAPIADSTHCLQHPLPTAPIAYSTHCLHHCVLGRSSVVGLKEQIERKEMQPSVSIPTRMIDRLVQIPKLDPGWSA